MTSEEIESEVREKRQLLSQTDYETIKAMETFFSEASDATTILGLVKAIKDAMDGIREVLASRTEWRARVIELEAMEPDDAAAASE